MEAIKTAIVSLATKSASAATSHEAMQYAQAALNLSQALAILSNITGTAP